MNQSSAYEAWHECQTCGRGLRQMTADERERVARNPYDYIFYCADCISRGWND